MPEQGGASGGTYLDMILSEHDGSGLWEHLRYDRAGDLWIGGLRVKDALGLYGAPLEIVDTTIIEHRCDGWMRLAEAARRETGYPGRLSYLYAAKANMASEVAHAAYRSGWHAETSSRQDLVHLAWLGAHDLLPPGMRVVCNGFKLPVEDYSLPHPLTVPHDSKVLLPADTLGHQVRDVTYAEAIVAMARDGWNIVPILDEGELPAFAAPGAPRMDVGLRMKLGPVRRISDLDGIVSRFGMDRRGLEAAAREIAHARNLRLVALHAMVGAAERFSVESYVAALLVAGEVWADLRTRHVTLKELNMGGGMPPLGERYDHEGFLRSLFSGLARLAAHSGVPAPDVTFEFGSLVAAECGFHAFRVLQRKRNHTAADGGISEWAIVDGGLMAAIPDMLLLGKAFPVLAVEGAHRSATRVRLGDVTCDSDGRYPPESFGPDAGVLMPEAGGPQHIVVQGVGAYQEILAGVRGAHHCGLLEAGELILERGPDGRIRGRLMPRQTSAVAAHLLGYSDEAVAPLRRTLG